LLSPAATNLPAEVTIDRFDDLFQRFYPLLFGLTYRVLGDPLDSEETLQEAFLRLVDADVLERPDGEVGAWLRRVCLNLAFNRLRDQRRARDRLERAALLEMVELPNDAGDPSASLLRREEQGRVRDILARLPERQRDCLLLRHAGYSYAEVAETVGVAVGSVGVLLARAERAFRATYLENNNDMS
jgi:RNA polymerase sigma-70 factor (ECF subfamily)